MRRRASIIVLLAIGSALSLAPAAAPADVSLAAYRTKMNAQCRAQAALLTKVKKQMAQATKAKNSRALFWAAGHAIAIMLLQDRQFEQTPFPTSLDPKMAPILLGLRQVDRHFYRAVDRADQGDARGFFAEGNKAVAAADRVGKRMKGVGLASCAALY